MRTGSESSRCLPYYAQSLLIVLTMLLVDGIDHVGDALELFLAGEGPVDRLPGLALGMSDREERRIRIADHVGLGILDRSVRRGGRASGGCGRADDQGEFAHLAPQL